MIRNTLRRLSTSIVHEGDDKGLWKRPQHGFLIIVRITEAWDISYVSFAIYTVDFGVKVLRFK